jgi:hypothetical protein
MLSQADIDEMLNSATSNGYAFTGWTVADIVLDMLAYADIGSATEEDLTALVTDWRTRNPEA